MASISFDPEDYVDEISTKYLIDELIERKVLPSDFKKNKDKDFLSLDRTPIRSAICELLNTSPLSSVEDIIELVKENYNK